MLGKLAAELAPPEPRLQHAALRLTAHGWQTAPLPAPDGSRSLAGTPPLILAYVVVWIPGRPYYDDGMLPAVLAPGAVAIGDRIAVARHRRVLRASVLAVPMLSAAVALPLVLPLLPAGDLHRIPGLHKLNSDMGDTVGWPQLTRAVVTADAALVRAHEAPTSIFTGGYPQAAALAVLTRRLHLPPVLSGHNSYWLWGPGRACDRTVLAVDAIGYLRPSFAGCRVLSTFHTPHGVVNDVSGLQIGVCTGPVAGWPRLWHRLRHYD